MRGGALTAGDSTLHSGSLASQFAKVPDAARPACYWWWFNGLIDREGITRDLEEFKAKGIGGVLLVNSAGGLGGDPIPTGVTFMSPEWKELYRHALAEAARLGIEVGVNLCAGWAMGGPWIEPAEAGRWVLQSRMTVTGPQRFDGPLPLPGGRDGYLKVFNPPGYKDYVDLPLEKLDYRDTAVVAVREPEGGGALLTGERLKLLPAKTNRLDATNFTRARVVMGPTLVPWISEKGDRPIPLAEVVDLTAKLTADGRLAWDVPPGRWTIVRTGHRMTGSKTMLGLPGADGLSVAWLNRRGLEKQFRILGRMLLEEAGSHAGKTLKYFCDDSFEDGFPNWTAEIVEQFKRYRGYDPTPYLPVFSGYIVGSAEVSDRFLYDYRKTVADCMADEHYGRFAELCHENGLLVQNEAAGPSRSGTMCMDGLKNLGRSDLPQGEFWMGLRHDEPGGLDPKLSYGISRLEDGQNKVCKMTASAAHVYGRRLASAESFTSFRTHWVDTPALLKQATDRAFCEGINRLVIHTSTATRPQDGKPGYEYGAGTHFNPNVTWWPMAGGFLSYVGRCQHLLQQGLFVADVLYYNGDWAPNLVEPKRTDPSLGAGFDYDVCNAEVLLTRVDVRDGRLVLPDGMSYRVLVLPETTRMPVEVLRKIDALVKAGATIVGPRPLQDPGLRGYPGCDDEVKRLSGALWGDVDGSAKTRRSVGKGRIVCGEPLRALLASDGIAPDFQVVGQGASLDFIHRSSDEADLYFVVNREASEARADCTFRIGSEAGAAEIWDPVTGQRRAARGVRREGRSTTLSLRLAPRESLFVVFPKVRAGGAKTTAGGALAGMVASDNALRLAPLQRFEGPWTVRFDPAWGGPSSIVFEGLKDWTAHPDFGVRHYSGVATYERRIDLPAKEIARPGRVFLHLGEVKNIAAVRLNGKALGVVWTAPWRIDLTPALRAGDNMLEIDVANTWPNRLIADASLPEEKRLTRTNIRFKPDAPLQPSGLLGPVELQREVPGSER